MSEAAQAEFYRPCPSCGAENAPDALRCDCGALLAGVDLLRRELPAPRSVEPPAASPDPGLAPTPGAEALALPKRCPHSDCAQLNPPNAERCLYCNRALDEAPAPAAGLLRLPPELETRYRILRPLPVKGAEAELLLVEDITDGTTRVAKVYRHGIVPKREVLERVARIDAAHRVQILEHGISSGHAFELMEYCPEGSLRDWMSAGALPAKVLPRVVEELVTALVAVHAAGVVHRDLKPENVLLRCREPLDLVLTDFGTASVLDATQRFTGVARTLPYAAPETLSGVIDAKADYWALGMMLLEAATGQHPFAGLSEAVILHHLATRGIDTAAIAEARLRQLARGLLLRDPKDRWGAEEIGRWRRGDATLPEPTEARGVADFGDAYRLAGEVCSTREQLAAALARHWREGVIDLANGNLLRWFRDTEKDQDTVRLLIDNRFEKKHHVDVQLLHLILHLAPGIPPVWQGAPLDLAWLASHANQALGGAKDARAALSELHERHVLEAYAQRGNAFANQAHERWTQAADRFHTAWRKWQDFLHAHRPKPAPGEAVKFDDLVFGPAGPSCPPLADIHPRLLAAAFDPRWASRWRERLTGDLAALQTSLPWLVELGETSAIDHVELLAVETLLPELRRLATEADRRGQTRRQHAQQEADSLQNRCSVVLSAVRNAGKRIAANREAIATLDLAISEYYALLEQLRAISSADATLRENLARFAKPEPLVARLSAANRRLAQHQAISGGWLSLPVLGVAGLVTLVLVRFLRQWGLLIGLAIVGGMAVWRLLPGYKLVHEIRALALRI
ncbi:MAG: serine/threonine protein kinase [Betaproteobacteria bacterium]|nr:serine/threonine protein kinase [Betaproteobacteria bacterium]